MFGLYWSRGQKIFHTKGHPTFTTGATTGDIIDIIDFLAASSSQSTSSLGQRLSECVQDGRFQIIDDLFWCQPIAFWDMPEHIYHYLHNNRLVIVKGNTNYRRLFGDRQWSLDIDKRDILGYFPVPFCILRTCHDSEMGPPYHDCQLYDKK